MKKRSKESIAKDIFKLIEKENCRQITFHYNLKTKLKLIWVIDSIPEKRDKFGKLTKEDLICELKEIAKEGKKRLEARGIKEGDIPNIVEKSRKR